jgi:hypothetical protein
MVLVSSVNLIRGICARRAVCALSREHQKNHFVQLADSLGLLTVMALACKAAGSASSSEGWKVASAHDD